MTDRRAGRIPTEKCEELCALLSSKIKKIGDTEVIIKAGKEHRFVVIFRGKGLEGPLTDSDPNREGLPIPAVKPQNAKSAKQKKAAKLDCGILQSRACRLLKKQEARQWFPACAASPISRESRRSRNATSCGPPRSRCIRCTRDSRNSSGMKKIEGPQTIREQFERYVAEHDNYDYFFIHYKYTDKHGEDGNFEAKKKAIEELDAALPILLRKEAGRARHHRRSLHALRDEGPLVASATGAAALGLLADRTSWIVSRRRARTSDRSACSKRNF